MVSAGVEVTYNTLLEVPSWTDGHLGLVVTTEDAGMVEFEAGDAALERTELGHRLEYPKDFFFSLSCRCGISSDELVTVLALIVDIDGCIDIHRGIITAAIDVGDITTLDFQISLIQLRKIGLILVDSDGGDRRSIILLWYLIDIVCLFRVSSACNVFFILVFAVAAAEKTTDGNPFVLNSLRFNDFRRTAGSDESLPRVVDDVRLFIILFLCQT